MDVKGAKITAATAALADTAASEKAADIAAQKQKVKQAAKDFEAVFLEIVLRSMRDTVQETGLVDGGNAEKIYKSMLDSEYAKRMADKQESGLSQAIEKQLIGSLDKQMQVQARTLYERAVTDAQMLKPKGL